MGRLLLIAAALAGAFLFARRETVQPGGGTQGGAAPPPPIPVAPYLTLRAGTTTVQAFAETAGVRVVTNKGGTITERTAANAVIGTAWALADVDKAAGPLVAVEGSLVRSDRTASFIVSKAKDGWVYATGDGYVGEGATRLATLRNAAVDAAKVPGQAVGVGS